MADSKITALASIGTGTDPANDPLVIVDVSDILPGGMSLTGTTKKVTLNNLLACSPTATLASATITGDLTVSKNTNGQNRLILSNPNTGTGAYDSIDFTAGTANNQILSMGSGYSGSFPYLTGALLLRSAQANGIVLNTAGSAAAIQFGINDTLAMTLNATGLGVGTTAAQKLTVLTNAGISAITATAADDRLIFTENMASGNLGSQIVWKNSGNGNAYASIGFTNGAAGNNGSLIFSTSSSIFGSNNVERMRIKPNGQVRFIPLAADPAGAESGDVYYNSTSNKLKCYNGTTWNDLF